MLNLKLARFPTCSPLPSRLYSGSCRIADPISSIRSERVLRFFAGAHDRELVPIIVKFRHHNRLMMNELKLD
jgi:hypothetical protein